ncbi:hypothetical protein PR048_031854 [Dryococelus australis]|uniref:Uncharacterized protein n=1 Tax=Dryococelus australis TaxID=614101 RepID=A0ABQ9G6G6_9NEOP|nr:hypothetical protein PR048_031854 [Dryococelus australis]
MGEENINDPHSSSATSPYTSRSKLQNAVKRVSTNLPNSLRKCKKLYRSLHKEDEDCMLSICEKCANIYHKDKYSLDELLQQMVRWDIWETMNQ